MSRPSDRLQNLVHMFWKFPKGAKDASGRQLASLVLREVDTYDMQDAAKVADANKTQFVDELVSISMVALNGEPLAGALSTEGWNAKAREWLMRCYNQLNHLSEEEMEELGNGQAVNPRTMKPEPKPEAAPAAG